MKGWRWRGGKSFSQPCSNRRRYWQEVDCVSWDGRCVCVCVYVANCSNILSSIPRCKLFLGLPLCVPQGLDCRAATGGFHTPLHRLGVFVSVRVTQCRGMHRNSATRSTIDSKECTSRCTCVSQIQKFSLFFFTQDNAFVVLARIIQFSQGYCFLTHHSANWTPLAYLQLTAPMREPDLVYACIQCECVCAGFE